jgi:hypothetical protein
MIHQYIITYDLLTSGQIYGALIDALKKNGGRQILLSSWLLKTRWSKAQTLDWMLQYLDEKDRLLVIEFRTWEAHGSLVDLCERTEVTR